MNTITTKDGTEIYYKDQIVPVKDSARKSARLIKGAQEIYYPGAPHGLTAGLLAFLRS
jgi:non-heme chloroperoxidase